MKLFDLNLRGSGFTLLPFVSEEEHTKFRELISYLQCGEDKEAEVPKKFTEKAYSVFEKWAGENKRLSDEGFHFCPCQM